MTNASAPFVPTAADVGRELGRYVEAPYGGTFDPDICRAFVFGMLQAPSLSPADALALVSWASVLLPHAIAQMPDDEEPTGGPKANVSQAAAMMARAVAALETSTGIAGEAFIGTFSTRN
ncbi:hypothetical protein [Antarcticirhabdus aurantiaca]|uniref:Uncharacterized protein n=1 Tax=Antarcticirhabdus aurantiaca TaxID=2606717 RepID=A0ACD4NKN0_9HYPH|nr:hypothetical protein [Antarcticirhabdus aurantiaca]WAJ27384.1 hypothetical protein OXU80_21435 [Jeongeuplla avenae]